MANWDTFLDMKNRVKDGLADHLDIFFSIEEIGIAINEGQWEIYKIIHSQNRGEFFNIVPETITLTSTSNYYSLLNQFAWIDEIRPIDDEQRYRIFLYKSRHDQEFRRLLNDFPNHFFGDADSFYYDVVGDKTLCIVPRVSMDLVVEVFTVQEPVLMSADIDQPTIRAIWRPLVVEYAIRKLKGKEETGEYTSNDKLLAFLLENLSKYCGPRGGTNQLTVEGYLEW